VAVLAVHAFAEQTTGQSAVRSSLAEITDNTEHVDALVDAVLYEVEEGTKVDFKNKNYEKAHHEAVNNNNAAQELLVEEDARSSTKDEVLSMDDKMKRFEKEEQEEHKHKQAENKYTPRDVEELVDENTTPADPKPAAEEEKKETEEEDVDWNSDIPLANLAAFALIISFLIFFTVIFEHGKEAVVEAITGTENEPIVNSIFAELTVLGFLALVCFLLAKFGLDHLSTIIFGHADVEEDKEKLGEMLEKIHIVIFLVMVVFIFEALGMLWVAGKEADRWANIEDKTLNTMQRKELIDRWRAEATDEDIKAWSFKTVPDVERDPSKIPASWEVATGLTQRGRNYNDLFESIVFMLMRQEFVHDEKDDGFNLNRDFSFKMYLAKIMGQRLGHVVELPVSQWFALEVVSMIFIAVTAMLGGSWLFLMCAWLTWAWIILIMAHFFLRYLKDIQHRLMHECLGFSMLESHEMQSHVESNKVGSEGRTQGPLAPSPTTPVHAPHTPHAVLDVVEKVPTAPEDATQDAPQEPATTGGDGDGSQDLPPTGDPAGDGTSSNAGNGQGSGSGKTSGTEADETTKINPPKQVVNERSWIKTAPRYLNDESLDEAPKFCCCNVPYRAAVPEDKTPDQRRFLNLFIYGKDEITFHLFVIRFFFLGTAVYMAVFFIQIVPQYIFDAYEVFPAICLTFAGAIPGFMLYFSYIYDIIDTSILITSVEQFRSRRSVEAVKRHQKESRCVMLLRVIIALTDKKLQEDEHSNIGSGEIAQMEDILGDQAKHDDMDHLLEMNNTIELEKLSKIFDNIDKEEPKGWLSKKEVSDVLGEFGITLQEEKKAADEFMKAAVKIGDEHPESISKAAFLVHMKKKAKQAQEHLTSERVAEYILTDSGWNTDGNKTTMTVEELQTGLLSLGEAFSANEVSAIVMELDMNDDGEFNLEELERWVAKHSSENAEAGGLFGFGCLGF
jgi:Ca2+-binding EF-hand superfamily protein